jgi:hypothetical protein
VELVLRLAIPAPLLSLFFAWFRRSGVLDRKAQLVHLGSNCGATDPEKCRSLGLVAACVVQDSIDQTKLYFTNNIVIVVELFVRPDSTSRSIASGPALSNTASVTPVCIVASPIAIATKHTVSRGRVNMQYLIS